ncbi:MAG: DNA recombination protein RmuC [Terriglobia bacterium]
MDLETILLVLLLAGLIVVAYLVGTRRPAAPAPALDPRIEDAIKSLPGLRDELGGLKENVAKLPSAAEIQGLKERLEGVEGRVPTDLSGSVDRLKETLTQIETEFRARKELEERNRSAIQKIEAVLVGAQSRGAAGEVVLAEAFAQFPPEMADTQFKVNGKLVEFALVLPNKKRLAIDSKWPAVKELEQYSNATESKEREELLAKIEKAVSKKVDEVTKYIDPASTMNLAIAAVPDAAYFACRTAHIDAYRQRVLLMPYSLTIPFLLALYNLHLQLARSVDVENLNAYLSQVETYLDQFEEKLDNSVERGATMVLNAYQELRQRIGQMRGTLAALQQLPTESLADKQQSLLKE